MAPRILTLILSLAVFSGRTFAGDPPHEIRVVLDPTLTTGSPSRVLTREERALLVEEARRCLSDLRALLLRPATRLHFQRHYGLNPVRMLERDDFAVVVRPFARHAGPAGVQVGGYEFGETTLDLNVALLRAARHAPDPSRWRRYVAGVLVHELAHLADSLDDGVNDDGGLLEGEEGEAAQLASGCDLTPPGDLPEEPGTLELSREFWSPRHR